MVVAETVQGLLFLLFAALTALLNAVLGPTYDQLLVPMLAPGALYPSLSDGGGFLGPAAGFSAYVVANLVDPAIPLLALGLGGIYLARSVLPELARRSEAMLPKFVGSVVLANFSLPVASALLGLAGAGYPVLAGFDGGAWQHWQNLGGPGFLQFSWDNGALAFVLSFVLFSLVLLLVAALAVRDALLAVLVVLLPLFTLLYPLPTLGSLAQRGWLLFGQLAFLPWVVVVPLELAVGASSAPLLVGYLTVALAGPGLLAMAGSSLTSVGLPSAGSVLSYGTQRSLSLGSSGAGTLLAPGGGRAAPTASGALRGAARAASSVPLPASVPFFVGELAGHGAARLFAHIPSAASRGGGNFPPIHPTAPGRGPR